MNQDEMAELRERLNQAEHDEDVAARLAARLRLELAYAYVDNAGDDATP